MENLTFALTEEIGKPELFVGREAELDLYLDWAENAKDRMSKSQALLSRRKKGKTALVQRLFNILWTQNDRQIVPFYYRIKEGNQNVLDFAENFYRAFVSQYLGFQKRDPKLVKVWPTLKRLEKLADDDPDLQEDIQIIAEMTDEFKKFDKSS